MKTIRFQSPGHWESKSAEKTIDELNKLLELRSLDLHVKEVRKKGSRIKLGDNEYKLSDFDTKKKNEILEELKKCKIQYCGPSIKITTNI